MNKTARLALDMAYPGRARIVNPDGASGNKIGVILGSSRLNSYLAYGLTRRRGQEPGRQGGGSTPRHRHELALSSDPSPTLRNR